MTTTAQPTFLDAVAAVVQHHRAHPELAQPVGLSRGADGLGVHLKRNGAHELRAWAATLTNRRWAIFDLRGGEAGGWYVHAYGTIGDAPVDVWAPMNPDYADSVESASHRITMGLPDAPDAAGGAR